MIPTTQAIKAISSHRGEAVVVSTTAALREWSAVSQSRDLDMDLSDCMDKAASVGLGIAVAQPQRKVLVLDCDSALRASVGGLATVGNVGPRNMVHFLFEDGSHLSTKGQPISGMEKMDFVALARGGGYARTYQFDDLEDLVLSLEEVLGGEGPTFVSLKVLHDEDLPAYPSRTMGESAQALRQALAPEQGGGTPP